MPEFHTQVINIEQSFSVMFSEEEGESTGEVWVSSDPLLMMGATLCGGSSGDEAMHVFKDRALATVFLDDPGILEDDIEVILYVLTFSPVSNRLEILACLHSFKQVFFFKNNFITISIGRQHLF